MHSRRPARAGDPVGGGDPVSIVDVVLLVLMAASVVYLLAALLFPERF